MNSGDTIAAISSASGPAIRVIVRSSGAESLRIASLLTVDPLPGANGAAWTKLRFSELECPAQIYEFCAPRSYSGEDMVEFHIPGNPLPGRSCDFLSLNVLRRYTSSVRREATAAK